MRVIDRWSISLGKADNFLQAQITHISRLSYGYWANREFVTYTKEKTGAKQSKKSDSDTLQPRAEPLTVYTAYTYSIVK